MDSIIEFLTSKEIIVVYLVAVVSCLIYFIISMIDKYSYKRKRKHNTKELNRIVEEVNKKTLGNEEINTEVQPAYIEPIIENFQKEAIYIEPVTEETQKSKYVEPIEKEKKEETVYVEPVIEEIQEEPVIISKEDITYNNKEDEEVVISSIEELIINAKEEEPEIIKDITPIEKEEIIVEELSYTDIVPNQTEAQKELKRLTEELEKASEASLNIDLTSYEEQQEKDAIISLDELMKKSKDMYENNEITQYMDEGNEPISLADLEKKMQEAQAVMIETEKSIQEEIEEKSEAVNKTLILDDFNTIKTEPIKEKKPIYQEFKSTPIISPVYGIEKKEPSKSDIELENTANYEKLDEEIRRTNEFLMTLKELKKNLE